MGREYLRFSELRAIEKEDAEKARAATICRSKVVRWGDNGVNHIDELGYFYIDGGLSDYDQSLVGEGHDGLYQNIKSRADNGKVRVLDVGCGKGRFLRDIGKQAQTDGILDNLLLCEINLGDIRDEAQKSEDKQMEIKLIDGDIQETSFRSQEFDLIISNMCILHLADPLRAIKKLYRHLAVGGEMFITLDRKTLRSNFFETRHIRSKTELDAWNNPQAMDSLLQESKKDVDRLMATIKKNPLICDLSEERLYIKKLDAGTLRFGNLGYSRDVLISRKIGWSGEGMYKWRDKDRQTIIKGESLGLE
ncbi:MAG: class I SAM-dependent methyltransferase [Candidatus Woesebacteria bacterium]|nr:MAG: class I SAM-dependent methyltransferase [Candidatus Woesebacteria bacterium]